MSSYFLRLNRKPARVFRHERWRRVSWGEEGRGAPFPSNSNFTEICFPFERSRSSVGQTKFRWPPTCVPNGFIALFPGRNSRPRHNVAPFRPVKIVVYFCEELESEQEEEEGGSPIGCVRGKNKRWKRVEARRFLLVKSDSQWWEIRNVKIYPNSSWFTYIYL